MRAQTAGGRLRSSHRCPWGCLVTRPGLLGTPGLVRSSWPDRTLPIPRLPARHDLQQRFRPDRNLTGERPVMGGDQQHRGGDRARVPRPFPLDWSPHRCFRLMPLRRMVTISEPSRRHPQEEATSRVSSCCCMPLSHVGAHQGTQGGSPMTMRPDPTFHASPKLAMEAPPESFAYTLLLSPDFSKPDALAVIDVKPGSSSFGRVVHTVTMPNKGDECHHYGWNPCSSALSPLTGH